MNVIGLQCFYVGREAPLTGRRLMVVGVRRGRPRADSGRAYLEIDDEEFAHEPVLPEE
jgi:hypothetical protein